MMKKHITRKRKSNTELDGQPPVKRRKMGIEEKFSLDIVKKQKQMLGLHVKKQNRELKRLNERNDLLAKENKNLGEVITLFHNHHEQLDTDLKTLFPNIDDKSNIIQPPPAVKEEKEENLLDIFLSSYDPNPSFVKREFPTITSSERPLVRPGDAVKREVNTTRNIIRTVYKELDKKKQEQQDFFRQFLQNQKPEVIQEQLRKDKETTESNFKGLQEKHQQLQHKYRRLKTEYSSKSVKMRQMRKKIKLIEKQFEDHDLKMRRSSKDTEILTKKVDELEKQNSKLVVKLKQQSIPLSAATPTTPQTATESPKFSQQPNPNFSQPPQNTTQPSPLPPPPPMPPMVTNIPQEQQQRRVNTMVEQENSKLRQLVNDLRIEIDEIKILLTKRTEQLERKDERIQQLQNSYIDRGGGKTDHQKVEEDKVRTSALYSAKAKLVQEYMEKNDQLYNELRLRELEIERLRGELSVDQSRLEDIFDTRSNEFQESKKSKETRIVALEQEVTRLRLKLSSMKYQEQLSMEVKQLQAKLESREKKLSKLQEELKLRGVDKKELIQRLHFSQKSYKIQKKKLEDLVKQNESLHTVIKKIEQQQVNGSSSNNNNNNLSSFSVTELMNENQQLKRKIEEMDTLVKNLGQDGGKEKIERLQAELSYEKEMTEQFEKEMEELSRHCQNLEKYKDKLNAQINQFQVEKRKYILENVKATNRNEIYEKEISLLKKEREQFQHLLDLKDKEKKSLKDVLHAKDKVVQSARQETEVEKKAQDKLRKDIQNLNLRLGEARQAQIQAEGETENQRKIAKGAVSESAESQRKANHYEEECEKLSKRLERIENSEENAELVQRIQYWKKFALCPICEERVKSKVITKCCHAFCSECLEKSVGARNRKCPQCADSFSPKSQVCKLFL